MKDSYYNAYLDFLDAIACLNNENNKKLCITFIQQAKEYYSLFRQTDKLSGLAKDLKSIYEVLKIDGNPIEYQVKVKDGILDINSRLLLNFYFQCAKSIPAKQVTFKDIISKPNATLKFLSTVNNDVFSDSLCNDIKIACKKAHELGIADDSDLFVKEIQQNAKLYRNNINKPYSEEKSFNEIYSAEYIKVLVTSIKEGNPGIILSLSPILRNLCSTKDYGLDPYDGYIYDYAFSSTKSKSNRPIRKYPMPLDELKKQRRKLLAFEEEFNFFEKRKKEYDRLFKQFKEKGFIVRT